jgi:hypothetical protein
MSFGVRVLALLRRRFAIATTSRQVRLGQPFKTPLKTHRQGVLWSPPIFTKEEKKSEAVMGRVAFFRITKNK